MQLDHNLSSLAYAYGKPPLSGKLRSTPEDFQVVEDLGFNPSGQGEHVFLKIEKTNANTQFVSDQIAKLAKVKSFDVSFAGMKDRNAITQQWFSVYLPKAIDIDWQQLNSPEIKILEITRHDKKLRRGNLLGNHFKIRISELSGDFTKAQELLTIIRSKGVPNYYGPQRFGIDGNNLDEVDKLFANLIRPSRAKRSILLSSARSWLFNLVLDKRIQLKNWHTALKGDVLILAGTHSFFVCEEVDETIIHRCNELDIFPSGPLYGQGSPISQATVVQLELEILQQFPDWLLNLEKAGLKQERRPLVLPIHKLTWEFNHSELQLDFFLSAGCYATSVLREIVTLK